MANVDITRPRNSSGDSSCNRELSTAVLNENPSPIGIAARRLSG
jgi:hypothetical protein